MYIESQGVQQDLAEALKWARKAANQGGAEAQFYLGLMLDTSQGVPQSDIEALKQGNQLASDFLQDTIAPRMVHEGYVGASLIVHPDRHRPRRGWRLETE